MRRAGEIAHTKSLIPEQWTGQTEMKRFHSRYDRVRRLREQHERLAKAEASSCRAELEAAIGHEEATVDDLNQIRLATAAELQRGASGAYVASLISLIAAQESASAAAAEARQNAAASMETALHNYSHARRELKTVDEVIHRELAAFRLDQHKHEEARLQEQASHAWHQNPAEHERTPT